jgi:hypothetical protein
MPSKSKKQHNFMEAIAHNSAFAKKVGVPQSVGQDFSKADKGRKFQKGGDMKAKMTAKMMKFEKSAKDVEKGMKEGSKKDMAADNNAMPGYKKGGMPKKMNAGGAALRGQGIAQRGYAGGGKVQTVQVKGVGAARARTAKIC